MRLINLKKETSERSDASNWAKEALIKHTPFYFESIEGCNQNSGDKVTHLFERARVDEISGKTSKSYLLQKIITLEGEEALKRKINFAKLFGVPLTYVLYCNASEHVYLFNFQSANQLDFLVQFDSYENFAAWISGIKGWKSAKSFREMADLPYFDKELRKHHTPWPANIDCFFTDKHNRPLGIIEFQNADKTGVTAHCNNDYFQCKTTLPKTAGESAHTVYADDIRRWTSQEILRVQSGLRFFIITWSRHENDFILKELDSVAIPYFPQKDGKPDTTVMSSYKRELHRYVHSGRDKEIARQIAARYKTYSLKWDGRKSITRIHQPPLSYRDKTFPALYYKSKLIIKNNRTQLAEQFNRLFE